jgi:hypothetical protein
VTTKEIFERVAAHLLAQGRASSNGRGACYYRGPGGLKCAVGCLIDDDHYRESLEGGTMFNSNVKRAVELSIGRDLAEGDETVLARLQELHDNLEPERWPELLGELRLEFFGDEASA